ncbi:DUF2213 domain-containing protein [Metabacillus fastidiosus]|uniref:DUF2213 domain-containing protein n=1 Tax=Metabacillus fastidiosus TaxID=1458 RepID=UPI002E1CA126|nr:DUF2213 domain-containing protein [Metabacillus fastidiosus]
MRTTKLQRFDRTYIKDYQETPEGYLTFKNVPITRTGVFPYRRKDGATSYEAKLPEEILSDSTVLSAQSKAITNEHPNELVTTTNHQQLAKGLSHTDARVDGDKILVSFTVTDSELISEIKDGKREVSIGFLSDIEQRDGEYNGQRFDAVQKNIEINHIAIVDQGRAGPEIGIRNDSDAWQIEDEGGKRNMAKYKIDSVEYEVDPVIKSHLEAQQAKLDAANLKIKEVDTLQGRLDAKDAQLKVKDDEIQKLKEKSLSEDELDAKVQERVSLIATIKPILGDSFDFKGKTDRELKEAVIQSVNAEFKGDSKSDDYINAFFDATTAQVQVNGFSSTGAQSAFTGDSAGTQSKEINDMKAQRLNMRS